MAELDNKYDNKVKDISLILKDLLKVIKIVSMYPEDNPLPQSLKRSFAERLESIIESYGEINIEVQKDCLLYNNEVVFQDRSKEENLAEIFFDTGITEFTLKEGLEVEEIYKLLEALKTYLNTPGKSQDLLTLIWESGISRFSFKTLEDIALSDYDDSFNIQEFISNSDSENKDHSIFGTETNKSYESIFIHEDEDDKVEFTSITTDPDSKKSIKTDSKTKSSDSSIFYSALPGQSSDSLLGSGDIDGDSLRTFEAASAMGFDDLPAKKTAAPNTALILNDEFKLSEEEEENIRKILSEDAFFEPFESTQEIIKEMLLQETEMNSFYETVTISEKIMSEFIQVSKLVEAGNILKFIKRLEDKLRKGKPLWAERLKDARITAGSRDRLKILADALNNHPQISTAELKKYLENFGWEALYGITDLIGQIEHQSHRDCLTDYLTEQGRNNTNIIAKGIYDKRPEVVRNSINILAGIGDDDALKYLLKIAEHKDDTIRLELITSLKKCPNEKALTILQKAVSDTNPEIRREAVNSIVARRGQSAFDTIVFIINDESFSSLEKEDQQSLLNAFSILGGEKAVSYLTKLLLQYNFFRNSNLAFFREAAFEALSLNRSEKCELTLIKLSQSWRPDIKRQAQETLKRRREIIFGGE